MCQKRRHSSNYADLLYRYVDLSEDYGDFSDKNVELWDKKTWQLDES